MRATRNASATPTTRRSPKERTSGLGESAKAAKPAIVATQAAPITGPPPLAASATARPGAAPSALETIGRDSSSVGFIEELGDLDLPSEGNGRGSDSE